MKSGFISVIGRPNVGKSTLLNQIMGEKLTITSNKPQTTRNRIQCIYNREQGQAVFIDTPGIHKPNHVLGSRMMKEVEESLSGIDLLLVLIEPGTPRQEDQEILQRAQKTRVPVVLVINKIDSVSPEKTVQTARSYGELFSVAEIVPISAYNGTNVDELIRVVYQYLPEGPAYFPKDMVTDQPGTIPDRRIYSREGALCFGQGNSAWNRGDDRSVYGANRSESDRRACDYCLRKGVA